MSDNQFFHCYRSHRFSRDVQQTIMRANTILDEMGAQGYVLSLRQLYYQFVHRNWIPNQDKEYKRLGRIVTDAREAGLMDWNAIEDRERVPYGTPIQPKAEDALKGVEKDLLKDFWKNQDYYIEVWGEKKALEGVNERPSMRNRVTYMACKGYLSASEAWRAGLRFQRAIYNGKHPVLIHLADHDPSGLNMTEDNQRRVRLFAESNSVEVRRIALNMDQVEQYNPPPNPAKESDSRARDYVRSFGPHSWELDALEPKILDNLIDTTIKEHIDPDKWEISRQEEMEARKPLIALRKNWKYVEDFLAESGMLE